MTVTSLPHRHLVTGGAGFIGSHLCEQLLNLGHEVLCVDNFYTGNKTSITHLLDNSRFELLRHDITFPLYVEVDAIWNLACPAAPVHYQRDPVQTTKTSVLGAINMLGLATLVIDLTSSSSPLVHAPLPLDDPRQRQPDIALARSELGWAPGVDLRDGLRRTIDYFDTRLGARAT